MGPFFYRLHYRGQRFILHLIFSYAMPFLKALPILFVAVLFFSACSISSKDLGDNTVVSEHKDKISGSDGSMEIQPPKKEVLANEEDIDVMESLPEETNEADVKGRLASKKNQPCFYKDEFISFQCPNDVKILLNIPLGPMLQKRVTFIYWDDEHGQYMPTGVTMTFPYNFRSEAHLLWPGQKVQNTPDDFFGLEEYYKNHPDADYKEMDFGERDGFMVDLSGYNAHFEIFIDFLSGYSAHTYRIVADHTSRENEVKRIDSIIEMLLKTVEFYQ